MINVQRVHDYAQYLINAKAGLAKIQKALNHNRLEEAKVLAHDVRINIVFLQDAIEDETRR